MDCDTIEARVEVDRFEVDDFVLSKNTVRFVVAAFISRLSECRLSQMTLQILS